jgi:hypothetical protein
MTTPLLESYQQWEIIQGAPVPNPTKTGEDFRSALGMHLTISLKEVDFSQKRFFHLEIANDSTTPEVRCSGCNF